MPCDLKNSTTPISRKGPKPQRPSSAVVGGERPTDDTTAAGAATAGHLSSSCLKSILKSDETCVASAARSSVSFAKTKDVHFVITRNDQDDDDNYDGDQEEVHTEQLRLTPIKENEEQSGDKIGITHSSTADHHGLFSTLRPDDLSRAVASMVDNCNKDDSLSYTDAVEGGNGSPIRRRTLTPYRRSSDCANSKFPDVDSAEIGRPSMDDEDEDETNNGRNGIIPRQKHMRSMMSILGDDGLAGFCNVRPSLCGEMTAGTPPWKIPVFGDDNENIGTDSGSDEDNGENDGRYRPNGHHLNPLLEEDETEEADDANKIDGGDFDAAMDSGSSESSSSPLASSFGVSEFLPTVSSPSEESDGSCNSAMAEVPGVQTTDQTLSSPLSTSRESAEHLILEAQALLASTGRRTPSSERLSPVTTSAAGDTSAGRLSAAPVCQPQHPPTPEFGKENEGVRKGVERRQSRSPCRRPSIHLDLSFMAAPSPARTAKEVLPLISSSPRKPLGRPMTASSEVLKLDSSGAASDSVLPPAARTLLNVLGLGSSLCMEMESAVSELRNGESLLCPDGSETFRGWEVSLEEIVCADCQLLGEISTNLAYLTAWELSDGRCAKFAEQLGRGVAAVDFEALLTRVDEWSLSVADEKYEGDTERALEDLQEVFGLRADVAEAQSRVMWKKSFAQQMTLDVVQLTYNNVLDVTETLQHAETQMASKTATLNTLLDDLKAEQSRGQTQAEMIAKWKQTLNYYHNLKAESLCRANFLRNQCALWREELIKLDLNLNDQTQRIQTATIKNQTLTDIIRELNQKKMAMLIANNWSVAQIEAGQDGILWLRYPVISDGLLSHFGSPFLLINGHHSVDNQFAMEKAPAKQSTELSDRLNGRVIALRHSVLTKSLEKTKNSPVSTCPLVLPNWAVQFQVGRYKSSCSANAGGELIFKGIQLGDFWLRNYSECALVLTDSDRVSATQSFAADLWVNTLALYSALGVCLHDLLCEVLSNVHEEQDKQLGSLETLGGCLWLWLGHINDVVEEIHSVRSRCDAFRGCFVYLEPPQEEDTGGSLRFKINIWSESITEHNSHTNGTEEDRCVKAHRMEIRMPCFKTSDLNGGCGGSGSVKIRIDLTQALRRGSLAGGYLPLSGRIKEDEWYSKVLFNHNLNYSDARQGTSENGLLTVN